jgi:4-carboxymuconolactone decarboxylase
VTGGGRIPKLEPAALDDAQRDLYQAIAGGRRAAGPQAFALTDAGGRLEGPFNAFLLQPRLGQALQALGAAVRYDTGLDDRCRELAILAVAAHWRSEFEWHAHAAAGRAAGLSEAEIDAARQAEPDAAAAALAGREAMVVRTAATLARDADLDDAAYREVVAAIGPDGLFELLTLVGYYAALALQLRVFRVPAPDGAGPWMVSPRSGGPALDTGRPAPG